MNDIFKMIFENLPLPMWVKDLEYKFVFINNSYKKLCNKYKEQLLSEDENDYFIEDCKEVVKKREAKLIDINIDNKTNKCLIFPIVNDDKELIAVSGMLIDENKDSEYSLLEQILEVLPGVIFYKDKESKYVYANRECREFYQKRGIDNIIGKTDIEINEDRELAKKFLNDDINIMNGKNAVYNEAVFVDENGEKQYKEVVKIPLVDNKGNVSGIVGRSMDVTEKRIAQEKLKYLSYTDILTGVYNRTYFEERIKEFSKEKYLPLGVIMGDANGLKQVNDTYGHQEGDNLIKDTAKVFKKVCEGIGEVFRIGGDEFVILLPKTSSKECENVIKEINKSCEEYKNELYTISMSLGYSIKKSNDEDILKIIKKADDKVYEEKLKNSKSIRGDVSI